MYFSENLLGINPVVMNYKIRYNKNQPAMRPTRYSLAWSGYFFRYYCGGRKTEIHGLDMRGYMQRVVIEEGLLSV